MTAYKQLSPGEQAILQHIRELEHTCAQVCKGVEDMPRTDHRALCIARTQLEGALMWLTKALTNPDTAFNKERK